MMMAPVSGMKIFKRETSLETLMLLSISLRGYTLDEIYMYLCICIKVNFFLLVGGVKEGRGGYNMRKTEEDLSPNYQVNRDCYEEKTYNVTETGMLKKEILEQRRVTLEAKLVELYNLREQKMEITQLQNNLEVKKSEIDKLRVTVDELQAERKAIHEKIRQNQMAEKQLDIARKRVLELQAKLCADDEKSQVKGQLIKLKKQVDRLQIEYGLRRHCVGEKNIKMISGCERFGDENCGDKEEEQGDPVGEEGGWIQIGCFSS